MQPPPHLAHPGDLCVVCMRPAQQIASYASAPEHLLPVCGESCVPPNGLGSGIVRRSQQQTIGVPISLAERETAMYAPYLEARTLLDSTDAPLDDLLAGVNGYLAAMRAALEGLEQLRLTALRLEHYHDLPPDWPTLGATLDATHHILPFHVARRLGMIGPLLSASGKRSSSSASGWEADDEAELFGSPSQSAAASSYSSPPPAQRPRRSVQLAPASPLVDADVDEADAAAAAQLDATLVADEDAASTQQQDDEFARFMFDRDEYNVDKLWDTILHLQSLLLEQIAGRDDALGDFPRLDHHDQLAWLAALGAGLLTVLARNLAAPFHTAERLWRLLKFYIDDLRRIPSRRRGAPAPGKGRPAAPTLDDWVTEAACVQSAPVGHASGRVHSEMFYTLDLPGMFHCVVNLLSPVDNLLNVRFVLAYDADALTWGELRRKTAHYANWIFALRDDDDRRANEHTVRFNTAFRQLPLIVEDETLFHETMVMYDNDFAQLQPEGRHAHELLEDPAFIAHDQYTCTLFVSVVRDDDDNEHSGIVVVDGDDLLQVRLARDATVAELLGLLEAVPTEQIDASSDSVAYVERGVAERLNTWPVQDFSYPPPMVANQDAPLFLPNPALNGGVVPMLREVPRLPDDVSIMGGGYTAELDEQEQSLYRQRAERRELGLESYAEYVHILMDRAGAYLTH